MALQSVDVPTATTIPSPTHAPPPQLEDGYPMTDLPKSNPPNKATDLESNNVDPEEPPLTPFLKLKLASAAFAFFTAGVNDGSLGALVPYILRTYSISTGSVAILYACAFAGWFVAAIVGGICRTKLGNGGVLMLGALLQLLTHVLRVWTPPFALFAVSFFLAAIGAAFQDAQANAFVATVKSAHRWLGVIHASYGAGCVVGPLVAAAIASNRPGHWPLFYGFAIGVAGLNMGLVTWAFWEDATFGKKAVEESEEEVQGSFGKAWVEMRETAAQKEVWLLSIFYFFYLGLGITLGGWLVEYLVTVRHGELATVGYFSTILSVGTTLGRLILVEPTHRFVSWRVDSIAGTAVCTTLMSFFLGPFFAAGMTTGTMLIPASKLAPSLGIIFVVAQAGGAVFPAATGVIAAKAGVGVLQPMMVGLIVAMAISWICVPKPQPKED
ncbi:hypothetical protein V495_05340 [Pseudogymnoascus sp. VKM F-4514 (FW-929)]|nr:hypothetical protein V495_05340 [Pseudogymnoascus sp. VKM F-4514 (FW-929)]KFY59376.1 hypothetical protein V497_04342 [Pseudogymnoascus sp. VKM F-4516 (FW-969)]